ncbi:hypothetical protein C7293_19400 [filamentous cyanobacterium CCT1]|nr:hypothetical protein C7293_19400 [filamentous cyanobacterium CCT1]
MSYKDFTLEKVRKQFGLAIESNQELFVKVNQPLPLSPEFTSYLNYSVPLTSNVLDLWNRRSRVYARLVDPPLMSVNPFEG